MLVPIHQRLMAGVLLAAFVGKALPARCDETADQAGRLVEQLHSPEFAVRQQATRELQRLGAVAIDALAEAAVATDSEVRGRALGILMSPELSTSAAARADVRQTLAKLQSSPNHDQRLRARATLSRIREASAAAAATELSRLGAVLMPVQGGPAGSYNVQIGANWLGGHEPLSMLAELGDVPWLSLESAPLDDRAIPHLAHLGADGSGPSKLFLGNTRISGARLGELAPLTKLQYLSLKQLAVTDEQLATLPEFPQLQYLGLDATRISDEGLRAVGRYRQLQVLWLDNTRITDRGLAHLRPLVNLRTLNVPGTACTGAGLAVLGELPNLTSLSLKGVALMHDSLKHLARIEQLEQLGLDQTNVQDEQLADLAGMTKLRILWLTSTTISDVGLAHLSSLESLQVLHLNDTQVTAAGAADLQRALPRCQVTISSQPPSRTPPRIQQPRNPPPPAPRPANPSGAG